MTLDRQANETSTRLALSALVAMAVGLVCPRAQAGDDRAQPEGDPSARGAIQDSALRGAFAPFSQAASVPAQQASVTGLTGYDTVRKTGSFEAAAEVRLWGPVAIRGGAVYTNGDRRLRPSAGLRVQALRESRHGVDGAVGVFYRPEGLTESEGELETVLSLGRHVGSAYVLGGLIYGQDPEGRERDGEARAAALRPVGAGWLVGLDSRFRFDLGSNGAKLLARHEPAMDALAGPLATAFLGPLALTVQAGASALRPSGPSHTLFGVFVMSGVGTVY